MKTCCLYLLKTTGRVKSPTQARVAKVSRLHQEGKEEPRWASRYRDRQEKEENTCEGVKEESRPAGGRRLTGFSRSRRLLALASQVLREEVMVGTQAENREGGRLRLILDTWTDSDYSGPQIRAPIFFF